MSIPFVNTLAAISADSSNRRNYGLIAALFIMAVWLVWLFTVPVALYSTSENARIEVRANILPIYSPINGRVESIYASLGESVVKGQLLVELDSEDFKIQLEQALAELAAIENEHRSLWDEIRAIEIGKEFEYEQGQAEYLTATARLSELQVEAEHAKDNLYRLDNLYGRGGVSEIELRDAKSNFKRLEAAIKAQNSHIVYVEKSNEDNKNDRDIRIQRLKTELADIDRNRSFVAARVRRSKHAISQSKILAPTTGVIGEVDDLFPGMYLNEGDRLGAFVPKGPYEVEANFSSEEAMGKIFIGQEGRLTFSGFPLTQYRSASVKVKKIAKDLRNGVVQVRLDIDVKNVSSIPLQHGMPVMVEVKLEEVSPFELLMRIAGKLIEK